MAMDAIRAKSRAVLAEHGLPAPDSLPSLGAKRLRPFEEILGRLFCLNAVAAAAYGLDSATALSWLHQEQLAGELTQSESRFLEDAQGHREAFKIQVEGMWTLAWAVGIAPEIDFWEDCDSGFVTLLPNLKESESVKRVASEAKLRTFDQIVAACDLSYCLHWIIREASLQRKLTPRDLKQHVVVERRRALEWMLSDEAWDLVSLDT